MRPILVTPIEEEKLLRILWDDDQLNDIPLRICGAGVLVQSARGMAASGTSLRLRTHNWWVSVW
jgi:hypothetical protein